MGLKESLKKLQEAELRDKNLSLKREVKKELTKLKNEKILEKKCIICKDLAIYSIKGSSDWYCKDCAIEYFGDLKHLKKISASQNSKNSTNTANSKIENKAIELFKKQVIEDAEDESFKHHQWYVKYHLEIVENISLELCKKYKDANKDLVMLLVWLHDYEKILYGTKNDKSYFEEVKELLLNFEISQELVSRAILYTKIIDKHSEIDLNNSPIEVKIVSSADGASHMIGPFFWIYAYENPNKKIDEIIKNNILKHEKDWNRKIVLPEVKKILEERRKLLLEQFGKIPSKFLNVKNK